MSDNKIIHVSIMLLKSVEAEEVDLGKLFVDCVAQR